jgi:formylglycine-generating enzyme required for sulfatase activity
MGTNIRQQREKTSEGYPIYGEGANFPMYYISWDETKEFIKRLNEKNDGFIYSLPSESQWEYAARAGTASLYHWGDDTSKANVCNYANVVNYAIVIVKGVEKFEIWGGNCRDRSEPEIKPVGSFRPNNFGLYDMSGNVFEWCEDIWSKNGYNNLPSDGSANISIGDSSIRIFRGGSWDVPVLLARSASRIGGAFAQGKHIGFRVAARLK